MFTLSLNELKARVIALQDDVKSEEALEKVLHLVELAYKSGAHDEFYRKERQ